MEPAINGGSSLAHHRQQQLHIVFLPFLAPGHMIPMVDLALVVAATGPDVKVTIVTTPGNVRRIQPTLDHFRRRGHIDLLTLPFPSGPVQNLGDAPTPHIYADFLAAVDGLQGPFEHLLVAQAADCIVTDGFYPWTNDVAVKLGIPRINFHPTGYFPDVICGLSQHFKAFETVAGDFDYFTVPHIPHDVKMTRSQIETVHLSDDKTNYWNRFMDRMRAAFVSDAVYGNVMNTYHDLEPEYKSIMVRFAPSKFWSIGPVGLAASRLVDSGGDCRGGVGATDWVRWVQGRKPKSVLFACFGSVGHLAKEQITEVAEALEACGRPFIWVLKDDEVESLPEGFEERVDGLVAKGWVSQMAVLNHEAVGGFLTHCGWNSMMEGLCGAGVPLVTWPLYAEQFFNERMVVDVLGVGVGLGCMVHSNFKEERTLVRAEALIKAIDEVMGDGEEAEERRRRAAKLAEAALPAVEEGGSSYLELRSMIQDLMNVKAAKASKANK